MTKRKEIIVTDEIFPVTENTEKDKKSISRVVSKGIEACELYLRRSSEKESWAQGRSQDVVGISYNMPKVTEDGQQVYEMELKKQPKGGDFFIRDKYNRIEYAPEIDFKVIYIDPTGSRVIIHMIKENTTLPTGEEPNMELSFDLRVLIINQKSTLANHKIEIDKPIIQAKTETKYGLMYVGALVHPEMPKLNMQQKRAAYLMLTQAIAIIIGPPGTGKTVTLSAPILSYMAAGIPVAIVTPTHVSLERSLAVINDLCRKVGIDLSRVVRLGTPTKAYANDYPETLEIADFDENLRKMEYELWTLKIAKEYRSKKESIEQRNEVIEVKMMMEGLIPFSDSLKLDMLGEQRANLVKLIERNIKMIHMMLTIPELISILRDLNYLNFQDYYEHLMVYIRETEEINDELSEQDRKILHRLNKLEYSSIGSRSQLYEEFVGTAYDYLNDTQLDENITKLKREITVFQKGYSKKKVNQALLLGMTIDSYNTRYKDEPLNVKHIFVDEAGYMPLIKVLGLCRGNIPLSLIGDPCQLAPVSEMDKEIVEGKTYESVLLYGLSTMHIGTLFSEGYEGLKKAYFSNAEPNFQHIPRVDLVETYRFGSELANVLDKFVYHNGFTSAVGQGNFKLKYIDTVNAESPPGGRINPSEAEAIKELLTNNVEGSVAILAAYKNQVGYLKKHLKGLIDVNNIMTIHRSQGQEWDTVIISVVDHTKKGAYGMFFTDSTHSKSKGLQVINTAVSRAKNNLILVGHHKFWIAQEKQLLGKLFRDATEIVL